MWRCLAARSVPSHLHDSPAAMAKMFLLVGITLAYPIIISFILLCVGVGRLLRLYDLGRKKLLRKCENKHIPHLVVDIKTVGERIICSDVQVRLEKYLTIGYRQELIMCINNVGIHFLSSIMCICLY